MWNFLSKFLVGFSYGSGVIMAIVCAVYIISSSNGISIQSAQTYEKNSSYLDDIEINNVSKLSNFTNYVNDGKREEFIFTGEIKNNSNQKSYKKLVVEIDLFDSDGKFIFKCGGWDGIGKEVGPQSIVNFQKTCHQMPEEIVSRYQNHKALIKQKAY